MFSEVIFAVTHSQKIREIRESIGKNIDRLLPCQKNFAEITCLEFEKKTMQITITVLNSDTERMLKKIGIGISLWQKGELIYDECYSGDEGNESKFEYKPIAPSRSGKFKIKIPVILEAEIKGEEIEISVTIDWTSR